MSHGDHGDSTHHGEEKHKAGKGCLAKTWDIIKFIWANTIDNVRFRMYALSIIKFTTITLIQANETFPKDEDYFYNYQNIFTTLGYSWMAILIILFTERYIRELICVQRKWALTIWLNWVEAVIFTIYMVYGFIVGIMHFVAIAYKVEYYGPEKSAIEFFEVIIVLFIIYEKWTHFLHSGHSISLYLDFAQHIPGHSNDDGGDDEDDHGDDKHGKFAPLLSDEHGHGSEHGHGHGHEEPVHAHGHEEHAPKPDHGHGHH
jgi:hypothetical protein